ncbi:MAG: PAS domain S-box protein [Nitrospira sp.]
MKDVDRLAMRVVHWAIPLLTIGIFVFDLLTPVGIAVSILYVIPLLLTVFRSKDHESFYFCGLATCLLWVGLFLKPPGSSLLYGVLNRTLGTSVLWILALGLIRFRRLQHEAMEAERELTVQRVERAHAEGLMMEAQQARYFSDREAVRAVVDRKEAEEQLLVAQLRLEGIIESAMDAIITVDDDQRIVLFNRAAERMFGCSSREAMGQTLDRFLPARYREGHRHHVHAFGQSGTTSRKMGKLGTVMGLRLNGEEFPIEAAISHIAVERQKYYTVILRDITERQLAQQQLDEANSRLRVATESGGIGVWDYSIPENRLVWDDRMYALYGYTPDHFPGAYEAWSQRLHPEDRLRAEQELQEAIQGIRKFDTEFRLLLPDGTTKFIKADALVLKDERGTTIRMIGVNRDITDQKSAEAVLQETTERLTILMKNAPAALAMLDRDLRYLAVSQRWITDYRLEGQDLLGRFHYEVFPEIPDRWKAVHQRGLRGEVIRQEEDRFVRQDGTELWLRWEVRPWYATDGYVGGLVLLTEDITERKRTQIALEQSEARLQNILNSMEEVVWSSSLDLSEIFYVSPAIQKIYGRSPDDFISQPFLWLQMIQPNDRPIAEAAAQALQEGHFFDVEYRIIRPDGQVRWIRDRGRIIKDNRGQPLRVDGLASDVTEKRTAEQAMHEAQERFEDIFESSKDAIGYASLDGTFVLANEALSKLTGYSKQELLSRTHRDLTPQNHHELQAKVIMRVLETGEPHEYEKEYIRKDGSHVPVSLTVFAVKGDNGKPAGVAAIVRDITERKRAEEALHESQRQLTTLIGNLPGFVYRCRNDRDRTFEYVSEGVFDLTGYTVQEYLTQQTVSYGENTLPDDRERVWREVQAAVEQHRPFELTYRVLTKSGEVRWAWERGEGIYAPDGLLKYLEGFVTDFTERKRAEHLLRQSEERYRRLVAVSPYAIFVNRGDRIIFANDQAIKLFGAVKADEILGKSPMDLFHPDDHAVIRERIHELLEGRQLVPVIEEKIIRLDGKPIDVEVSAARFADEEGPAILVMLRDVSERKRLQAQLRRTERIAELGTLASGMAHEIGTPMNVILGRAEYLMDRVTEEPIKKGLQTIITQVERITRVMNQLLSFARRKAPERVALDLKQVVEDSLEMFHERLARSQIQVELLLADPRPMVLADADQMSQVMINLVMNAVHAMPDGGNLHVGLAAEPQMVKLTIADTGHGIPREMIKKIFEPFFTTKEFGQGTGLGLTVVKGIIEEHQGTIAVESEEGKGTTFTILFPKSE